MPASHRSDCFCLACVPVLLRLLDGTLTGPLAPTTLHVRLRLPTRVLHARTHSAGAGGAR